MYCKNAVGSIFSSSVINGCRRVFILYSVNKKFLYKDVDCRIVYCAKLKDTAKGRRMTQSNGI